MNLLRSAGRRAPAGVQSGVALLPWMIGALFVMAILSLAGAQDKIALHVLQGEFSVPLDGAASSHSRLLFYWAGIPRSRSVGVR